MYKPETICKLVNSVKHKSSLSIHVLPVNHTDIYLIATALTPGPVQNLKAAVDLYKPAVILKWDPPANAGCTGDVTDYQVRFGDKEKGCYNEFFVDGSITTTVITRELGLRPLTTSTFQVRAYSGIDESQEWTTMSTFVGRL